MKKYISKIGAHIDQSSKKRKTVYALGLLIVLTSILTLAIGLTVRQNPTNQTRTAQIQITQNGFEPANLSIKKGTIVTWLNTDQSIHQIAANPHPTSEDLPSLISEILNNDQSYQYTFEETGTFGYHDKLKPTINGTIEVKD